MDDDWTDEIPKTNSNTTITLKELTLENVIDLRTSIFKTLKFKVLGFTPDERQGLRMIIEENGGEIINKNDIDYAIVNETFKGISKQKFDEKGITRTKVWLFNCIYYGKIIEEKENMRRSSKDLN